MIEDLTEFIKIRATKCEWSWREKKTIPKRIQIEKTRCNKIVSCVECQPRPIDVNSKNCRIKHTIFQSTKTPHTHNQSRQSGNERTSTKIQIKINENNNWIELNVLYIQYFFLSVFNFVFVCWFLLWFVISCTFLKIIDIFFSLVSSSFSLIVEIWTKGRCVGSARTAMCIVFWLSSFLCRCFCSLLHVSMFLWIFYVVRTCAVTGLNVCAHAHAWQRRIDVILKCCRCNKYPGVAVCYCDTGFVWRCFVFVAFHLD